MEFEEREWDSEDNIKAYQTEKIISLVRHAYNTVPFYRNLYNEHGVLPDDVKSLGDIKKLPLISKSVIKKNINKMISSNWDMSKMIRMQTGGSTGEPMPFYWTKTQKDLITASAFKNYRMTGWNFFNRTMFFSASPIDIRINQRINKKIKNILKREMVIPFFGVSQDQFKIIKKKIENYKPQVVMGFVSSLYLYAQWLIANNYSDVKIPIIVQMAEKVEEFQIDTIERAFNGKFFKHYGSREMIGIGVECNNHNGLHINHDTMYVELLKDNMDVGVGETGEFVMTSLFSYGMPLIRYKIGDIGKRLGQKCDCGRSSWLGDVTEGRIQDIISTTDGTYISSAFFPHLFKEVSNSVAQYQVIQKNIESIDIKIIKLPGYDKEIENFLRAQILRVTGKTINLNFKYVKKIELEKSGKFRAVKSEIPINFGN